MLKVLANFGNSGRNSRQDVMEEQEKGLVHYEGVPLIGSSTLCGSTDWTGVSWDFTTKRVNCVDCLATRDHVLGTAHREKKTRKPVKGSKELTDAFRILLPDRK